MSIDFTGDIYRNSIRNYWNINASVSCDGIIISVGNISRATIFKFRIRGHDDYCPTGRVTPIKRSLWALKDFYALYVSKALRSEEHTSELQSLMRISYAVFCLKKKKTHIKHVVNKKRPYHYRDR